MKDFYTTSNFVEIIKGVENMGKLKAGYFSDDVEKLSKELRDLRKELKNRPKSERVEKLEEIDAKKSEISQRKEAELEERLKEIVGGKASFIITQTEINGNNAFITGDINALLISQIIKQELKRSYRLSPANMDMIIEQVIGLLDNPMPKAIIRADICKFFESIPQAWLLKKLANDGFISKRTLKYLKGMLFKCNDLNNNHTQIGVPRGLAFSSYLSELYMKSIDETILKLDGIYLFKRYVDDIIIIADPAKAKPEEYWQKIATLFKEKGLKLHDNDEKKYISVFDSSTQNEHFTYLGYKFLFHEGLLTVGMSEKRFNKYITMIDAIFEIYSKCSHYRSFKNKSIENNRRSDALHQLVARLNTLTSNGFLTGRKHYVSTGIFYSNKYLTDYSMLSKLDIYLACKIEDRSSFCPPSNLFNYADDNDFEKNIEQIKNYLHQISFMSGFKEKSMYKRSKYSRTLLDLQRIYQSCQ